MDATRVSGLAARLADARASGRPIDQIPEALRPCDLEEGYAVQAAVRAHAGVRTVGYKLGLTSAAARLAFGAEHPIVGALAPEDVLWSPARRRSDGMPKFAEAEVVFVIGRELGPEGAPFAEAEVRRRLASAHGGIELCSTRYAWEEVSLPELVADNANAWSLVVGPELANWRDRDFAALPVVLRRNGHEPVAGSTSAVMGDPIRAVTWLANWLAGRGESLKPGDVVASGSCTGVTALEDEQEISAEFGDYARACAIISKGAAGKGTSPWI